MSSQPERFDIIGNDLYILEYLGSFENALLSRKRRGISKSTFDIMWGCVRGKITISVMRRRARYHLLRNVRSLLSCASLRTKDLLEHVEFGWLMRLF